VFPEQQAEANNMSDAKETIKFYGSNGEYTAHLRGGFVEVHKAGPRWEGRYPGPSEAARTGSGSCMCPVVTVEGTLTTRRAAAIAAVEARHEAYRAAYREAYESVTVPPGFRF